MGRKKNNVVGLVVRSQEKLRDLQRPRDYDISLAKSGKSSQYKLALLSTMYQGHRHSPGLPLSLPRLWGLLDEPCLMFCLLCMV